MTRVSKYAYRLSLEKAIGMVHTLKQLKTKLSISTGAV
jgi:hypothetical protein